MIGIAGELVKGTTSTGDPPRGPQAPMTEEELARIVGAGAGPRRCAEAEQRIAWESGVERLDVRLVHAAIVEMKIDGYPVSNPIGFTGAQVELAVFNAFAPMVHLGALQSVATQLGLELMGVIAEPYAVATCLDPGELGDAGAVFMDVGGGTTDVALVRHGGIAGTKMLASAAGRSPRAGRAFLPVVRPCRGGEARRAAGIGLPCRPRRSARRGRGDLAARHRPDDRRPRRGRAAAGPPVPVRRRAELRQIGEALAGNEWWHALPFARRPDVIELNGGASPHSLPASASPICRSWPRRRTGTGGPAAARPRRGRRSSGRCRAARWPHPPRAPRRGRLADDRFRQVAGELRRLGRGAERQVETLGHALGERPASQG